MKNYDTIKKTMGEILSAHQAKGTFIAVDEPDTEENRDKQDSITFSGFLKQISNAIRDGDRLYVDMNYGLRIYNWPLFSP